MIGISRVCSHKYEHMCALFLRRFIWFNLFLSLVSFQQETTKREFNQQPLRKKNVTAWKRRETKLNYGHISFNTFNLHVNVYCSNKIENIHKFYINFSSSRLVALHIFPTIQMHISFSTAVIHRNRVHCLWLFLHQSHTDIGRFFG